jgi:hypothetical protein
MLVIKHMPRAGEPHLGCDDHHTSNWVLVDLYCNEIIATITIH